MAVNTQIFPVRAIGWIIVVIAVLVVYGQKMPVLILEFPRTLRTDESVNLERALPVTTCWGLGFFQLAHNVGDDDKEGRIAVPGENCTSGWPTEGARADVPSEKNCQASSFPLVRPFPP